MAASALRGTALRAFVEVGFHAVGVREIARAAGVSEAAMYRHWPSKEALAVDVFLTHVRDLNGRLETALTGNDLSMGVARAVAALCQVYDEEPLVFRFVLFVQHELSCRLPPGTRMPMDVVAERLAKEKSGQLPGTAMGLSAALVGIFLQTATYVMYGRLPGPLSSHSTAITGHARRVLGLSG